MRSPPPPPPASPTGTCPSCSAVVPVDPGWTPWCECGWNVDPEPAAVERTAKARAYASLMQRHRDALFQKVSESGASRPSFGTVSILLGALSVATLAAWIALPAAAAWLLVRQGSTVWALLASALLLLLAFVLRPRTSLPGVVSEGTPRTHPHLFAVLRDVARDLGTDPPRRVLFSTEGGAWAHRLGGWGRRTVVLGLPLLLPLEPQACVALLAHETAHFANGDATRGPLVGGAIDTVARWCDLLTPRRWDESGRGIADAVAAVMLWMIALLPQALLALLVHLAWRRSQQAEYHADRLATRVAGSDGTVALLERTLDGTALDMALHRIVVGGSGVSLAEEMSRHLAARPPRERERLRRRAERAPASSDATRPPTGLRIRMLRERPRELPSLALSPSGHAAILAELSGDAALSERALVARRRAVLLQLS